MDEIIESIRNGQRKQALEQLQVSPYSFDDLFEYLLELNMPREIIILHRIALATGHLILKE